jgi:CCR4-NOT transcription complex subunit 9
MVTNQIEKPSPRLLKHIIRCYNRLAENPRARLALKDNLPVLLKEAKLLESLDESSKKCLKNLTEVIQSATMTPGGSTLSLAGSTHGGTMDFSDASSF